jgi:hypothetical protein
MLSQSLAKELVASAAAAVLEAEFRSPAEAEACLSELTNAGLTLSTRQSGVFLIIRTLPSAVRTAAAIIQKCATHCTVGSG